MHALSVKHPSTLIKPLALAALAAVVAWVLYAAYQEDQTTRPRPPTASALVGDTAAQLNADALSPRQADEWQRCLYVYHDRPTTAIRECLVIHYKWEPAFAERRLTLFVDSLARIAAAAARAERFRQDSIARHQDSLARRRDSIYLTTHRERLDGPPVGYEPGLAVMVVADKRTGAYYLTDCEAAKRIPVSARDFYMSAEDARQDHRWPSRQPGCR